MSSQLALDGLTAEPQLSERQAQALAIIREHAPIRSEELGAYLCERTGRHSRLDSCQWCTSNGRAVGEELHRKELVRYVRRDGWVPADWKGAKREVAYDPATAEVPF